MATMTPTRLIMASDRGTDDPKRCGRCPHLRAGFSGNYCDVFGGATDGRQSHGVVIHGARRPQCIAAEAEANEYAAKAAAWDRLRLSTYAGNPSRSRHEGQILAEERAKRGLT